MPDYPGPGLQIHSIEVSGPAPEAWPTESFRRVFGDVDPMTGKLADAERLLRELLPKAFRRPLTRKPNFRASPGHRKPTLPSINCLSLGKPPLHSFFLVFTMQAASGTRPFFASL